MKLSIGRICDLTVHHSYALAVIAGSALAAASALDARHRAPILGWTTAAAITAAILLVILHINRPCGSCITRAMLHDTPADADKRLPLLDAWHTMKQRILMWRGIIIALLVVNTFADATAIYILITAAVLTEIGLDVCHHRWQHRCPWCRDNGGDDHHADTPDPADHARL